MSFTQSSTTELTTAAVGDLVLEQLPSGDFAWLRPDTERAELDAAIRDAEQIGQDLDRRLGWPSQVHVMDVRHEPLPDDARFGITDAGRRALAMEALFGQPWPSVAEAVLS